MAVKTVLDFPCTWLWKAPWGRANKVCMYVYVKELGKDGETVPSICSYVDVRPAEVGNKTLSAIREFSFSSYSTWHVWQFS